VLKVYKTGSFVGEDSKQWAISYKGSILILYIFELVVLS